MLGSKELVPTASEMEMREIARKSIVTLRPIRKGDLFSDENIGLRRPGTGMPPDRIKEVLGKCAACDLPSDHMVSAEDIA